jgi:hypothetical protein
MENKKFNLEDRLVGFACMCLDVCDFLPATKAGHNLEYQKKIRNKKIRNKK